MGSVFSEEDQEVLRNAATVSMRTLLVFVLLAQASADLEAGLASMSCYDPSGVNCTCTGRIDILPSIDILPGAGSGTIPSALSACTSVNELCVWRHRFVVVVGPRKKRLPSHVHWRHRRIARTFVARAEIGLPSLSRSGICFQRTAQFRPS